MYNKPVRFNKAEYKKRQDFVREKEVCQVCEESSSSRRIDPSSQATRLRRRQSEQGDLEASDDQRPNGALELH